MAIDIPLELDSGPITWVKAEIDSALYRALAGLEQLRTHPTTEGRNSVRAELHQVSGAFELVGIEGLAILVQEFERHFATDAAPVSPQAIELVDRGCRRLLSHLKEMASGAAPVPLRFISEYLALGKLRGTKYAPADLFFPDLSRRPARLSNAAPPEPSRLPAFLLRQRRDFQQGLLRWLRGSQSGLDEMRLAVAEIEGAYPLPSQRSFWMATHALLEAVYGDFVEPSTALKQLMARVDLQMRRFVEGSTRVADRLRREVLYHLARARSGHPIVDEVKALYELDILVPKRIPRDIDIVALQPAIDALSALVLRCKDAWTSLNSGRNNALAKLREAASALPEACDALRIPEFATLGRGISAAAAGVADGKPIGDDLSMEFAGSLILIQTALEHIASLPRSFRVQVDRALQRLAYASSNVPVPAELRAENDSDSLTRLAQEKQTISQVAREIRANMRLVEQALDVVFRDRSATEELKPIPALLGQVSGAMRMLGWNDANELLTKTSERLIDAVKVDAALSAQDIDSLADVLAGLSFYVDVRERRDRDADEVLAGLKRRFFGETDTSVIEEDSVEASLAEHQRKLRPLARAVGGQPDIADLRDSLRTTLQGVRQDAELLSDPGLSAASNEALRLLDRGDTEGATLSAALAAVAGNATQTPPTSAETTRLVDSKPEERDTALLEIFVEEATEVIAAVQSNLVDLERDRGRRDLLVDTRRAFHTLKGSGRMVGQIDLAEAAWRVERALNHAIEAERALSEPEVALIASASHEFEAWIDVLRRDHEADVDVTAFDDLIERCAHAHAMIADAPVQSTAPIVAISESGGQAVAPTVDAALSALPAIEVEEVSMHDFMGGFDAQDDDLNILGVSVSKALFSILTDESRVHLQTLEYELMLMQFDTSLPPSDAMVRASHTLCGIHRTAGFLEIGDFAGLVETSLMAVRRAGRTSTTLSALSSAVQCLRTLTLRLQARSPLSAEEHGELERGRILLYAIIAETGSDVPGVEVELLEQTKAEETALSLSDQNLAPLPPALAFDAPVPSPEITPHDAAHMAAASVSPGVAHVAAAPKIAGEAMTVEPAIAPPNGVNAGSVDSPLLSSEHAVVDETMPAQGAEEPAQAVAEADHFEPVTLTPAAPLTTGQPVQPAVTAPPPGAASVLPLAAVAAASVSAVIASSATLRRDGNSPEFPAPNLAAPRFTTVTLDDPLAEVHDDLDAQVLPIFLEEAQDLYPRASEAVSLWRKDVHNDVHAEGLKRTLHTLKGSARMAGAMRLGELAHIFETSLLDTSGAPNISRFDSFDEHLDDIAFLLERLTRGERDSVLPRFAPAAIPDTPSEPVVATAIKADEQTTALHETAAPATSASVVPAQTLTEMAQQLAIRQPLAGATAATSSALSDAASAGFLRVRSDAVEQLSDEAGEISIHRSRIEAEMRNLKSGLLDLTASVVRLRGQLREIEIQGESQIQSRLDQESQFDPLEFDRYTRFQELTRGLAEGVNDVATVQQSLLKNLADADNALSTQTRLSRSVQLRLQTLRTVPFSNVSDRLYRVLRQTAKELKKRANLDIRGGRIEIDRSVLERLAPVLEHLVRNALAHGIEAESIRQAQNKSDTGELTLTVRQQGNEVAISLADDGGGIPLDKVRSRAVAQGLIDNNENVADSQLLEFIFQSGFSTADQITAVAGRGVGMDVVRNEVTALGGRVEVNTEKGKGTTFTLSVPLTLAVTQVLLVAVGKSTFGIPSSIVDQVRQIPKKERIAAIESGTFEHAGKSLPYRALGALVRVPFDVSVERTSPVMILRAGDAMAAVEVDRIISNQEVVAKPYGPQLARVPGLAGLTVLANGTITLLLNPINLIITQEAEAVRRSLLIEPAALAAPAPSPEQVVESVVAEEATATQVAVDADATVSPAVDDALEAATETNVVAFERPDTGALLAPPASPSPAALTEAVVLPLVRPTVAPAPHKPLVLVVDDSLTVRKITTRLLEREGYRAMTAKDGLDALQVLADNNPDVILLDIEMPRMDGFEFAKTIKADNRQSHIPIIMITSRTAEKHRNHARELGVNEYVGKPYQDEELMALVAQYAGKPT
ncbi:MAG TPA: Hpt domain-containing protein [Casimicrobium sp.]|nr:Hpt domain-containing protein [Casimicrobium sp.]